MADIQVKLVKSLIGSTKPQIATAHALGLHKIGDVSGFTDDTSIMEYAGYDKLEDDLTAAQAALQTKKNIQARTQRTADQAAFYSGIAGFDIRYNSKKSLLFAFIVLFI